MSRLLGHFEPVTERSNARSTRNVQGGLGVHRCNVRTGEGEHLGGAEVVWLRRVRILHRESSWLLGSEAFHTGEGV